MTMKYKCAVAGIAVTLVCLAGWLANKASGQPEPPPGSGAQAPASAPQKDLGPTKEDAEIIRAYQQRYATKPQATSNDPPPALTPPTLTAPALSGSGPAVAGDSNPKPSTPAPTAPAAAADATKPQRFLPPAQGDLPVLDTAAPQTNDDPSGRQEPAVTLEWIGPAMAKLGQSSAYQIVVKNVCSIPVSQVIVRVRIPTGLTVQGSDPKPLQEVNTLIWDLGTLQPHQDRKLDLQMVADIKGDLPVQALVTFTGSSTAR